MSTFPRFYPLLTTAQTVGITELSSRRALKMFLIYLLFMILLSCLDSKVLSLYSFTTAIISSVLICCLAPTEAANKPLNHKQYLQQKNRSITLSLINIALAFISNLTIYQFARLYTYYSSGALCTGLLLVAAKAGKGDILPRHIS